MQLVQLERYITKCDIIRFLQHTLLVFTTYSGVTTYKALKNLLHSLRLLQMAMCCLLQNVTNLLQIAIVVTICDKFITKCSRYLQNATILLQMWLFLQNVYKICVHV